MKYFDASETISGLPPSHLGRGPLRAIPMVARIRLRIRTDVSPCLRTALAPLKSFAPQRWATCTEKPEHAPAVKPPRIHVLVEMRPMDAEGFAPRRPTMPASMYCISIDEVWARIAGRLSITASIICCLMVICRPPRIIASNMSFLLSVIGFKGKPTNITIFLIWIALHGNPLTMQPVD